MDLLFVPCNYGKYSPAAWGLNNFLYFLLLEGRDHHLSQIPASCNWRGFEMGKIKELWRMNKAVKQGKGWKKRPKTCGLALLFDFCRNNPNRWSPWLYAGTKQRKQVQGFRQSKDTIFHVGKWVNYHCLPWTSHQESCFIVWEARTWRVWISDCLKLLHGCGKI